MHKKAIYLDRQIVIDAYQGKEDINNAIKICKQNGYTFPYSPAWIEEVVKSKHCHNKNDIDIQINYINELSGGIAFMPTSNADTDLRSEDIYACRNRVEGENGRNLTELVNMIELEKIKYRKYIQGIDQKQWEKKSKEIQKLKYNEVFSHSEVYKTLELLAIKDNFRIFVDTFHNKEKTVEVLYNVLEYFGFKSDNNEKRIENRVHDISHIIYAASAEIFVTNDDKLNNKAKAIYCITGLTTQVLTRSEFLDFAAALTESSDVAPKCAS